MLRNFSSTSLGTLPKHILRRHDVQNSRIDKLTLNKGVNYDLHIYYDAVQELKIRIIISIQQVFV